jgi:hypothetical protein
LTKSSSIIASASSNSFTAARGDDRGEAAYDDEVVWIWSDANSAADGDGRCAEGEEEMGRDGGLAGVDGLLDDVKTAGDGWPLLISTGSELSGIADCGARKKDPANAGDPD